MDVYYTIIWCNNSEWNIDEGLQRDKVAVCCMSLRVADEKAWFASTDQTVSLHNSTSRAGASSLTKTASNKVVTKSPHKLTGANS